MAAISITITESPLQVVSGIPSSVVLSANVPATIFYTLDGTDPSTSSSIAIDAIKLPGNETTVTLKAYATDGLTQSPIIEQQYHPSISGARNAYDKVLSQQDNVTGKGTFPFGSSISEMNQAIIYGNTAGIHINNPDEPSAPDGYDAVGNPAAYINTPKSQFSFVFSETDSIGQRGRGIGTLPAEVIYVVPRNDNHQTVSSDANSGNFDPKALVIFQDGTKEPYDPNVVRINRPYFDLEDPVKARDATLLTAQAPTTSGSFIKQHFNPTDNTMTYYYYDNRVGRWIISKESFNPAKNKTENLSGLAWRSSGKGAGFVYKWIPFKYRTLI